MKRYLLAIVAFISLFYGCSSSNNNDPDVVFKPVTNAEFNGTWLSTCDITGVDTSEDTLLEVLDGNATLTDTFYSDEECLAVNITMQESEVFTYIFGGSVVLDGSVAGQVSATEIDILVGGVPEMFNIVAVDNQTLYVGDTDDAATDGTTADKRPVQLDPDPFTKQP